MSIQSQIISLRNELPEGVELVAVSKFKPVEDIMAAYEAGQRLFGESRPQELVQKYEALPKDISWHMIGHLQTNKVKYIAPFVELIHSVDSERLLAEIDRQAARVGRTIDVLLEVHLAEEESKSGWDRDDFEAFVASERWRQMANVRFRGLMTIATFTDDMAIVRGEFEQLKALFQEQRPLFGEQFDTLSMGMTDDYQLAIECGSNMVRIGSKIFGSRNF